MFNLQTTLVMTIAVVGAGMPIGASLAQEQWLAKGGKAEAAIVVGRDAREFDRWVAGELRRYVKQLSGAELAVAQCDELPTGKTMLVVGSPKTNRLVAAAQERGLVDFSGLKPEGLILKKVKLDEHPAVIVGGNDETGTMYAAYEFLERLGVVFQLTGDIIPQKKPDLAVPALDVRMEPQLKYRGMHCCHGLRWYMGLADFRKHIDQLAKLKLNCLQFYAGMGSPWVEVSYGGKRGDIIYSKESGYVAWDFALSTSGTARDVRVGRECFPSEYIGPPEFADVQTPEQAFATARKFLREIIRYAHQRKVQVWLMQGEVPYGPPNLAPEGAKSLHNMYCGVGITPGDPAMLGIWEAAFTSAISTYPEADAYGVWTSELFLDMGDPKTQELLRQNEAVRQHIPALAEINKRGYYRPSEPKHLTSDLAQVCVTAKLIESVKKRHPKANLGVAVLFRSYLFPALDSLLPKDVWLMSMENWHNSGSVMSFYGDVEDRELIVMPRIDDDGCELHMQMNAMMYDRDEIVTGSAKYGVAGIVGQLNKERGLENNVRYMADGAWNPQINCRTFYGGFLGRVFGLDARETLLKAYLMLEENDRELGWHGRSGVFIGYNRFSPIRLPLRTSAARDARPEVQREVLEKEINAAVGRQQRWTDMAGRYRKALDLLRQARPRVLPGAQAELDYVIFKTESFAGYLEVLAAAYEAIATLDRALLLKSSGHEAKTLKQFEAAQTAINRADRLAEDVARQMIPYAGIPTEKYLLFRFNQNVISSIEALARTLRNATAPPALIAHWTFDAANGSTVPFTSDVDGSIVAFDGTLTGTAKIDTRGRALIGAGAYLGAEAPDNDSGITLTGDTVGNDGRTRLGDQLDLAGVSSMTFATWVKSSRTNEYGTLFHGYGAAGYRGYGVQTWPNTGRPRYHPGWSENPFYDNGVPGPPNVMDGDWHHLVLTANGAEVRFYVDGKTEADWKKTQPAISHGSYTGDRFIGHHLDTEYDTQIVGYLDDMGIWRNKVLSATEVALLHGLGRVQGSDLSWLDEGVALWIGDAEATASIDGILWKKTTGLNGSLGDWGGSKNGHDGYVVLDASGGGIRMMAN